MSDDTLANPPTPAQKKADAWRLAAETHIPTCTLRWFVDYDGERILQQQCVTPNGWRFWKDVPVVSYDDY